MQKKYIEYREKGLCVRCGAERYDGKTRCKRCHEEHLGYQNKAKKKLEEKGICRWCGTSPRIVGKSMCQRCLEHHSAKGKKLYAALRDRVIIAYGGYCVCCGQTIKKYLQLDHKNNDGKQHRLEISKCNKGGMYTWAEKNGYPEILQLLCANCHQAKTGHGGCTIEDHPPYIRK